MRVQLNTQQHGNDRRHELRATDNLSSSSTSVGNPPNRKSDTQDEGFGFRNFGRELSGRHAMLPPAAPISQPSRAQTQSGRPRDREKDATEKHVPHQERFREPQQHPTERPFFSPTSTHHSLPSPNPAFQTPQTLRLRPPFLARQPENPPYRNPSKRSYGQDVPVSHFSPPISRTGIQQHSPIGLRARLSLAPQQNSPFFNRPSSVMGYRSSSAFGAGFSQRPESARPAGGGLGELLRASGGSAEGKWPKKRRRTVRRE